MTTKRWEADFVIWVIFFFPKTKVEAGHGGRDGGK